MARLTQKAIWQAFQAMLEEMPFDKITVSALVKRAGVSPNTFYYHYQDIYDLLRVWFHTILNQQVDIHAPDFHWQSATKTLLHICQAHPKIVYHIFDSLSRNQLERYVFSLTDDVFYQQVCRQTQGSGLTQSQLKEVAQFCRYAFVGFCCNSSGIAWRRMWTRAWTGWEHCSPTLWTAPPSGWGERDRRICAIKAICPNWERSACFSMESG